MRRNLILPLANALSDLLPGIGLNQLAIERPPARVSKYTCVIASLFRHLRIEELRREHRDVTGHRRVICPALAFAVASPAGRRIYQSSLKSVYRIDSPGTPGQASASIVGSS